MIKNNNKDYYTAKYLNFILEINTFLDFITLKLNKELAYDYKNSNNNDCCYSTKIK